MRLTEQNGARIRVVHLGREFFHQGESRDRVWVLVEQIGLHRAEFDQHPQMNFPANGSFRSTRQSRRSTVEDGDKPRELLL